MNFKQIMGKKKRAVSIGQRLKKLETVLEKRKEISNWVGKWTKEQQHITERFQNAIEEENFDQMVICIGELTAMTTRRLETFERIKQEMF